jgi:hypothetical protein
MVFTKKRKEAASRRRGLEMPNREWRILVVRLNWLKLIHYSSTTAMVIWVGGINHCRSFGLELQ